MLDIPNQKPLLYVIYSSLFRAKIDIIHCKDMIGQLETIYYFR